VQFVLPKDRMGDAIAVLHRELVGRAAEDAPPSLKAA